MSLAGLGPRSVLNWTRSSSIQGGQSYQCCSSSTRGWPSRSRGGAFGLESAIIFDTSSGTNTPMAQLMPGEDKSGYFRYGWLLVASMLKYSKNMKSKKLYQFTIPNHCHFVSCENYALSRKPKLLLLWYTYQQRPMNLSFFYIKK